MNVAHNALSFPSYGPAHSSVWRTYCLENERGLLLICPFRRSFFVTFVFKYILDFFKSLLLALFIIIDINGANSFENPSDYLCFAKSYGLSFHRRFPKCKWFPLEKARQPFSFQAFPRYIGSDLIDIRELLSQELCFKCDFLRTDFQRFRCLPLCRPNIDIPCWRMVWIGSIC